MVFLERQIWRFQKQLPGDIQIHICEGNLLYVEHSKREPNFPCHSGIVQITCCVNGGSKNRIRVLGFHFELLPTSPILNDSQGFTRLLQSQYSSRPLISGLFFTSPLASIPVKSDSGILPVQTCIGCSCPSTLISLPAFCTGITMNSRRALSKCINKRSTLLCYSSYSKYLVN